MSETITLAETVTRLRENINDESSVVFPSDNWLKNKIYAGVRLLRERFNDYCSSWAYGAVDASGNADFNQHPSDTVVKDNMLDTLSTAAQIKIAFSQRFEDMWKSAYVSDIGGSVDTRNMAQVRKEVIEELDSNLMDHMSAIYSVFNEASVGYTGLDRPLGV